MYSKEWDLIYQKIRKDFGFSLEDDELAADILDKLMENKKKHSIDVLERKIHDKDIVVFGAGPSLENILKERKFPEATIVAVDGATTALLEYDILPDIIVTDLDGKPEDQIKANHAGSIAVVHAHGDNIDKINKYVPKFEGILIGTIQVDPSNYKNLYNFGGFTDGDRAAYMAAYFKPRKIHLVAFDFETVGRYSFTKNTRRKLKKLRWCQYLLKRLEKEANIIYI